MRPFRVFLFTILLVLGRLPMADAGESSSRPPNIIFILADDLGWSDTGVYGSRYYETPNIDRLAEEGERFTSFHTCQNCAPSRAAFMSGEYSPRTGVYTVGNIDRFDWSMRPLRPVDNQRHLPSGVATIAQQLKAAGYATAMFGKWHLGDDEDNHPSKKGFDEAISTMGLHYHFKTDPVVDYPKDIYLADWLTDKAEDFIKRNKDRPFFLYLPHFGVHAPWQAKEEWIEHFKSKPGMGEQKDPVYAAMIASVDESVGRVMKLLNDLKISGETVLIFASDNGGVGGYAGEGLGNGKKSSVTDNAPLRSGKGSLYEGGTRVPFIVRWPGVTKPGSVCDVPAVHVDLFPTLLEISGAPKPPQILDGESLVKLFKNPGTPLQRAAIYQHFPGYLGAGDNLWRTTPVGTIQSGDWKLMEFFEDGRLELYNLRDDIGEKKNLAAEMPDKTRELREKMLAWRKSVNAPMPVANTGGATPVRKTKKNKAVQGDGE